MTTRTHHIGQSLLIGIAVIPITMAISYVLMGVFDRLHWPTAARAAAWLFGMVWAWPIALYQSLMLPAECGWDCRANRHGAGGLSVLAPIPYVLIADLMRRRWRSVLDATARPLEEDGRRGRLSWPWRGARG